MTTNKMPVFRTGENLGMFKGAVESILGSPVYGPRSVNTSRRRRTRKDLSNLHDAMADLVAAQAPMTLRQLFYALTVRGLVPKEERAYKTVGRELLKLRRAGRIDWTDIADNTRWVRRPRTFRGVHDALLQTARLYRRALWTDAPVRVEVWCEKDALAGVIVDVTDEFDVPLFVSRGFASETYIWNAADAIAADGRPTFIYEFGDHDPSGVAASEATERKLFEYVDGRAEVTFTRAAIQPEQIEFFDLPTRPTKRDGNNHAAGWHGDSVELDAVPPDILRAMVRDCIARHIDQHQLKVALAAEASERELLIAFARRPSAGGAA